METFAALLAICAGNSPVPGEFPTQRPVTRSFDVYFDLRPNKWLSKQSWGWWFETLSCSLWRHRNDGVTADGNEILVSLSQVFNLPWIITMVTTGQNSASRVHWGYKNKIDHWWQIITGGVYLHCLQWKFCTNSWFMLKIKQLENWTDVLDWSEILHIPISVWIIVYIYWCLLLSLHLYFTIPSWLWTVGYY